MNRLIVFKDDFVFVDVTDIAKSLWGKEDLYVVDVAMCIEGGHLPTPSIDWWDDSEKITHEGYVYVRTKDIIK
jgi:hypothetical protein